MNKSPDGQQQFYFSLPRLIALLCGGNSRRAESNGAEAWLAGLAIFFINYLFFATFIPAHLPRWQAALLLILLAFWIWLFWLLLLYVNSLIIKLLRSCGVFRTIPDRRAQSVLLGIATTAMAYGLLGASPWMREIGAIWLVAVAMNLASAFVLAFTDAARQSAK